MIKRIGLKRLLILVMVFALTFAAIPAVMGQDAGGEEGQETEQVDEAHGEEEEAGGGPLDALGINLGFLIAQGINFFIIFFALSSILWNPARNMLDSRSQKIQKGLEDAAEAARARQNAEAEADKIMAEARSERQKLLEEARQAGDGVKKQIESEARQEAERIRAEAQADATAARNAQLADLRDQVLQIASAVAGRVLNENIDAKKQAKLVSDFFSNVPEGAKNLSGNVEVISAMPLSDDEKKSLEKAVKADGYTYTVDPAILGGLILRGQDKVVDGSVRGNLDNLTSTLK
jgi:F-type H+-transporting ATPase subunit b